MDPENPSDDARDGSHGPARGEGERLGRMLDAQLPALTRFIASRAGGGALAHDEADDLAQSVCRDLLESAGRGAFELRGDAELRQWLFGAAQRKLRSRWRSNTAVRRDFGREVARVDDSDPARRGAVEPRDSATPSRFAIAGEQRERVLDAISRLGERDASVLTSVVLEGRSHAETARRLGIEVGHSRVLLSRAMARLAAELDRGDDSLDPL